MVVREKCKCGGEFEIVDRKGLFLDCDRPDEDGRIFRWQLELDIWRTLHSGCMPGHLRMTRLNVGKLKGGAK